MKKRIGISFTPIKMANYLSWFNRQGLENEVELVELSFLKNNIEDFERCDAFILTGGDDIDPSLYGGQASYQNMPQAFSPQRDEFEKKIFEFATQNKKPLLGICRGLQMVNVILGGKLLQDAGEGNNIHKSKNGIDKTHWVSVVNPSLLFQVTQQTHGQVNSAHHQLIDPQNLGHNLMVNAMAANGEIEGIEYADKTNKPFMLCVQWHPERMSDQQNVLSQNVLEALLSSISN